MSVELDATVAADATVTDGGRAGAPASSAGGLLPGAMLAHFRIEAILGKGGMGEVYRASDLALDRPVALKVLPVAVAHDLARRERLFREARSQARLQHPNVCHIYYVGQQDGVVFFAMELVAGESLAERLARGPLPPDEAVELVRQAAMGLREAHRHGFTHRDVKPSNLMVDREGRIKVVDFGLVRTEGEGSEVAGTPLYMAPEQAAGAAIDARADIYALGATLHHLVSGRPPFKGDSLDALVTQHRTEARPRLVAAGRRGRALSAVDAVIGRMMAKQPEARHASYDELIAELERISPARTRPAGFWVRAFAMFIDLLLFALVAAPIEVLSKQVDDRGLDTSVLFVVVGPIYTVIGLSRWGTTIGRWLLDIEVTTIAGMRRPSLLAAAIRHAVEYGPITAAVVFGAIGSAADSGVLEAVTTVLAILGVGWGVGGLIHAAVRTRDKRAPWDRAAGTMVRYRVASTRPSPE